MTWAGLSSARGLANRCSGTCRLVKQHIKKWVTSGSGQNTGRCCHVGHSGMLKATLLSCLYSHPARSIFSRRPTCGRCGQVRHPGVDWLRQEKGWGGQEGDAGQQVCPPSPPSPLLPHPQQPHPHGGAGPGGVEISFSCVLDPSPQVTDGFPGSTLNESSGPLTFSSSSPYSPTAWPWASPSPTPTTTPTPPITSW